MQLTPETAPVTPLWLPNYFRRSWGGGLHLLRVFGVRFSLLDFCLRLHGFEMLPIAGRDQGLVEAHRFCKWSLIAVNCRPRTPVESRIFKEQLLWRRTAADWLTGGERLDVVVDVACDGLEVIRGAQQGE